MLDLRIFDAIKRYLFSYFGKFYAEYYPSFTDAITALSGSSATLYVRTEIDITADLDIPTLAPNLSIVVLRGGSFSGAHTVTFGAFDAGLFTLFSGGITVLFTSGKIQILHPEWFGAIGDGTTNDGIAINTAITALPYACTLSINNIYAVASTVSIINKFGISLRGSGSKYRTGFKWTGSVDTAAVVFETSNIYYCHFSNFKVDGNSKAGITHLVDNYNTPASPTTYPIGTHENFWDEVMFLGSTKIAQKIGITLLNRQIDWLYFNNCHFSGAERLVRVEGSNTFHIYYRGGEMNDFTVYGLDLVSGGQVHLDGVGMSCGGPGGASFGYYFKRGTLFGIFTARNCQQEGDALTLEAPDDSGSANNSPITIDSCTFGYTGTTTGPVKLVDYQQRGALFIRATKWGCNPTAGVKAQLSFAPPGAAATVITDGISIVSSEVEIVSTGNTLPEGHTRGGIFTAGTKIFLGTKIGRTLAGLVHQFQIEQAGSKAMASLSTNTNDTDGSIITLAKSRATTLAGETGTPGQTIVQNGDTLGIIKAAGADGVDSDSVAAEMAFEVDGVPGSNDMPGRIVLKTTPDGSDTSVKRWIIDNLGKFIGYNASAVFKMLIDPINARIQIGNVTSRTIASVAAQIQIEGVSTATGQSIVRNSADANGPAFTLAKTRSTAVSTNTIVQAGDSLGKYKWAGADGSDLDGESAFIEVVVSAGTTPGGNDIATDMVFNTCRAGNNDATESFRLTTDGKALSNVPIGGLGYGTGAGNTVTQNTSKATGVHLDNVSGEITMNNAALLTGVSVSFTLTNSAIAATDFLMLKNQSGGTPGAYTFDYQCAAGSAVITVTNRTIGTLSEAIVLGFAVFKGVIT